MNLKLPVTEDDVEGLVRTYLDHEARHVDVARLLGSLAAQPAEPAPAASTWRRWPARVGSGVLAACLCAAVAGVLYLALSPEQADAYALVEAAELALSKGSDRCYRIEGQLPPAWVKVHPFLRVGDDTKLWTRGKEFRVSRSGPGQPVAWGQDRERNFWLVDGDVGFLFRPRETPGFVNRAKPLLALRMSPLVQQLLKEYDLTRERTEIADGQRLVRVHATLKPGQGGALFDVADLEIDPSTKLLRELHVGRKVPSGRTHGLSFTLIEQQDLGDDGYRIESSLPPGGEVFGPDRAAERNRRFQELLQARRASDPAGSGGRKAARGKPVQNKQSQADAVHDE